jgi:hypothetical protein
LAILLAFHTLTNRTPGHPGYTPSAVTIFSDCQGAIKSIQKPKRHSGQYLIEKTLQIADNLTSLGFKITLQWALGHQGVVGIEQAYNAAREATRKGIPYNEGTVRLKSRTLHLGRTIQKSDDTTYWDSNYSGRYNYNLDKAFPRPHMTEVYNSLTYHEAQVLVQLRTANIRLNQYQHRVKVIESPMCECGLEPETVRHFHFLCP